MIKITKSPLPVGVTITKEEDYRSDPVFAILAKDCHDKCYICEDSVHTAPNVEHRISHRGGPALKYDWNNLLLACSHCNSIKSVKYDGIIDPTKSDPEKFLKLSLDLDDELRELVLVRKIAGGGDVDITVDLLNAVYNGAHTDMKKLACQNLKNKISNDLSWFRQKLDEYKTDHSEAARAVIERNLSDRSLFAAFKREIIRRDPEMAETFALL